MLTPKVAQEWGVLPVGRSGARRDTAQVTFTTATRLPHRSASGRVVDAWNESSLAMRFVAVTGVVLAIASGASGRVPVAGGLAAAVLVAAALVDVHERRLPNRTIALSFLVLVAAGLIESGVSSSTFFGTAAVGAAVFASPVLLLHLISPRSMGFGDVKLSAVLGAILGSVDWPLALWALAIGAGLSATIALAHLQPTVAFGPGLVAATVVLLALSATAHTFQIPGS